MSEETNADDTVADSELNEAGGMGMFGSGIPGADIDGGVSGTDLVEDDPCVIQVDGGQGPKKQSGSQGIWSDWG